MDTLKELFKLVTPYILIVLGFLGSYLKLHLKRLEEKIEAEQELREKFEKDIKEQWEKDLSDMYGRFKSGLKTEGRQRQDILKRHDDLISELFEKKVDEKLCEEKHKFNGIVRRKV